MNIKQEIAKLKAKLAELEAKANEPLDCCTDTGFYVRTDGDVNANKVSATSNCDYNIIRNKKTAEEVAPLVQIQRALVNFKCEHDTVFNNKYPEVMYTIEYFKNDGEWDIGEYSDIDTLGSVWFSTKKLAQSALNMLKRRNLV